MNCELEAVYESNSQALSEKEKAETKLKQIEEQLMKVVVEEQRREQEAKVKA